MEYYEGMISQSLQALVKTYRAYREQEKPVTADESPIHVDEVAFKIARFYEKVRNIIDYQEEHLLRKRVIFRALQRRIVFGNTEENIGESLIKEIIRSGHLPNDTIPEAKIRDVNRIIENLAFFLESLQHSGAKGKNQVSDWLIKITSSGIEERLDPPVKDTLVADTMYHILYDRTVLKGANIPDDDKRTQLFIAVQRALLRVDDDQLSYRLIQFAYPQWDFVSNGNVEEIAAELFRMRDTVRQELRHPLAPYFFKLCNCYNTVFYLLGDVVAGADGIWQNFDEVVKNEEEFEELIKAAYQKRYAKQKKRLGRLAFFSVLSLFISKVIIAFALEIPIDLYVAHDFSLIHTVVNMIFPPLLMFIIILLIRMPSKNNVGVVLNEVRAVVYEEEKKEYACTIPKQRNMVTQSLLRFVYVLVFFGIFYSLFYLLKNLHFSIASIAVFFVFVSLVVATGAKVHNRSKELKMEKDKAAFFSFLVDLVSMPLVTFGKIIIGGLSKFHFLVIVVNFIDFPFQSFLNFIESMYAFVRSKRDEMF